MIDDRLILLPLCRKHFITRQDKLTLSFIELTVLAQPSSKLVAFSCGSRFKLHALILTVISIAVVGSCVTIAFIQVVLEAVHAGSFPFFFRPAAVIAGFCHFTLINTLSAARCPIRMVGNCIGIVLLTIGIGVCQLLAARPDQRTVQIYICAAGILVDVAAKPEDLRAGDVIPGCCDMRGDDVQDVLGATKSVVADAQRLLSCKERGNRIHGAVFKINRHIIARVTVTINIYGFTFGIECAISECVRFSCIGPQRIICAADSRLCCAGGIEGNIVKCSRCIAPVIRTPIENTIFQRDILDTNVALCIVGFDGSVRIYTADNRHILESDAIAAVKTVIAVAISPIGRLRSLNLPRCSIGTSTHKGQALVRYFLCTAQRVYALAKFDGSGSIARCRIHSSLQGRITLISDPCYRFSGAGCVLRKSQHGKHLKHHRHCQQGRQKPVLTFLFQLSSFLSSLFAFLQRIPRKEPSRFLPHCHLPCRFHFPHCRSQPGC